MSIRYQIDKDKELITAWYGARIAPDEYVTFLAEVAGHPVFRSNFRLLAIFDESVDMSDIDVATIKRLQDAETASLGRAPGAQGVILAHGGMVEVISKLYADLAADNPDLGTDIRVVSTRNEVAAILGVNLDELEVPGYAL